MKNAKAIFMLLLICILVSIGAGYVAGFYVYREYREKTEYLEAQARNKFKDVEKNLQDLYLTLENKFDENKIEREKALSKLEEIRDNIKEWERGYRAALLQLRGKIEDLKVERLRMTVEKMQDEMKEFRMKVQDMELKNEMEGVDLGKISVKQ